MPALKQNLQIYRKDSLPKSYMYIALYKLQLNTLDACIINAVLSSINVVYAILVIMKMKLRCSNNVNKNIKLNVKLNSARILCNLLLRML